MALCVNFHTFVDDLLQSPQHGTMHKKHYRVGLAGAAAVVPDQAPQRVQSGLHQITLHANARQHSDESQKSRHVRVTLSFRVVQSLRDRGGQRAVLILL